MNETLETSPGRQVEVWVEKGGETIWLAAEANYARDYDRAQIFMTQEQAKALADLLLRACTPEIAKCGCSHPHCEHPH